MVARLPDPTPFKSKDEESYLNQLIRVLRNNFAFLQDARHINYDDSVSELGAKTVQDAIDDLVDVAGGVPPASAITYDNAGSGLSATDVQGALDEIVAESYTNEMAQDTVASMIQNNTGITWTYSDVGNTLTPSLAITNSEVASGSAIAVNKLAATTASRALASDASGFITPSTVTSVELGYMSGVTSAIQTQLDSKRDRYVDLTATTNVNIASAPSTIDGVAPSSGLTVLLTAQSTSSQNGIYTSSGIGAAMTRLSGYDTDATIRGSKVWAQRGSSNVGVVYQNTNTSTITVGSTNITYTPEIAPSTGLGRVSGRFLYLLSTGVSAATYGNGANVPVITFNAQGQATSATTANISISYSQIYDFSTGVGLYSTSLSRAKALAMAENPGA